MALPVYPSLFNVLNGKTMLGPLFVNLSQRTLMGVSGDDAVTFLQGQLTQDVIRLTKEEVAWAAHCSPKGRVLATLSMWREDSRIFLDAPEDQAEFVSGRLRMFVLRSRVTLEDLRPAYVRFGLIGVDLRALMTCMKWPAPPAPGTLDRLDDMTRVSLSRERLLLQIPVQSASPVADLLQTHCLEGSGSDWNDACVQEGVVEVGATTRDEWVPQMINWDLLGGISFKKGCYTGQEIVARTHYLGKIKRRTLRFRTSDLPVAGSPVLSRDGNVPVGKVAMVGATREGKTEFLAVMQLDDFRQPLGLHEGDADLEGPLSLPYTVIAE